MPAKARTSKTSARAPRPDAGHIAKAATPVPIPPVAPFRSIGTTGVAEYGGYVQSRETNAALIGATKWKTLANLCTNVSIVASGVRRVMGLVNVDWRYEAANDSAAAVEIAESVTSIMSDLNKPWPRVARKLGMFRYNGASIASWQAKRRPDGKVGFARIDDRPIHTIEKWIRDEHGDVLAMVQRDPKTGREIVLPRGQTIYLADDTLSNNPEGLGLLRHCVEPAKDLAAFKKNQGIGFETDLRGIPSFAAPLADMVTEAKAAGNTSVDAINAYIAARIEPLTDMMNGHVRGSDTGMLLDSAVYADRVGTLTNVRKWTLELLRGDGVALEEVANAIKARMWEIAIILNIEGLLVGSDGKGGSMAMDVSKQLSLLKFVQGLIDEIVAAVQKDLVERLMWLNGWPLELMPTVKTSKVEQRDIAAIAAALRDLAAAGIVLDPNSEIVYEFMSLMGFTWTGGPEVDELDAAGRREPTPGPEAEPEDGEDPLDPEDDGGGTEGEAAKVEPEKKPVRKRRR